MVSLTFVWASLIKRLRGTAIRDSFVHKTSKVCSGSHFVCSSMDKFSFCGSDCEIVNCAIGSYCSIADGVKIGGARHPIEWVSTSPVFYSGRDSVKIKFANFKREEDKHSEIGNDVWIGANTIIIQGVKIGNGAVIGAGSVVTHDVDDYEIVAGDPAKVIRKRFSEETINVLLKSRWWDLPESQIKGISKYVKDPQRFAEKALECWSK